MTKSGPSQACSQALTCWALTVHLLHVLTASPKCQCFGMFGAGALARTCGGRSLSGLKPSTSRLGLTLHT